MAYITAPYLNARLGLQRLAGFQQLLSTYETVINNMTVLGLSANQLSRIQSGWKQRLKTYFDEEVQRLANEAIYHALAAASESDNKNSLLTPIIAGVPVNPVAADNLLESGVMLADGALAATQLTDLINKVTTMLA
jgi:hypothetical protein